MAKKKVAPVKKTAAKKAPVKTKPARPAGGKVAKVTAKKVATKTAKAPSPKGSLGTKKVAAKTTKSKSKPAPKPVRKTGGKVVSKKTVAKPTKIVAKVISKPEPKKIKGPSEILTDAIVEGILEVKGRNISILNLKDIHNRVCDYFIICQADSNTQVNAIAGSVEEMVKKLTGERPYRKEGFENSEWILVDYVTVVVHIFQTEVRNFYNLESLWADADVTEIAFDK